MPVQNEKQRVILDADEPISITVDASDLTGASAEPLKSIIGQYGRPVVAHAFADFQLPGLAELAVQLYQMGFTLIHCPTWPNGDGFPKSVVSDILAQNLRDQLEELDGVETFLVVATSREYIAVVNALRRHDKRVVVVAEETKVAKELRLCADEFVVLPPSKAETRVAATRTTRSTVRTAEPRRIMRAPEVAKVEPAPAPARVERVPERPVERTPEPARAERAAESADQVRLPSDTEVLAEVRKIVTAEGICTPRRLARALCPVDRTPTGELRSRIANRIQTLVDAGKLVRERLVVGGTSVETIVVGDERNGHVAVSGTGELAASTSTPEKGAELEGGFPEPAGGDGAMQGEILPEEPVRAFQSDEREKKPRTPKVSSWAGRDLDAIVESVLRGPDAATVVLSPKEEPAEAVQADAVTEAEAPAAEAPKRTRSRRRAPAKKASSGKTEKAERAAAEPEVPAQ